MFAHAIRIALLLPVLVLPAFAAGDRGASNSNGSVSGTVKDTAGAVLQGAQVALQPTATTVASDAQGDFLISNIKPGTYTLTISYVGFNNSVTTIVVNAGQATTVNATMIVNSANQQVLVNANLVGDAAAINEQRTSPNILDVQTDTQIQSLPNQNVADAIGRMPAVTLQRNEGEGQYVQIRGTEPRLSNTTIDGVVVPGPDPEVRQVDLDTSSRWHRGIDRNQQNTLGEPGRRRHRWLGRSAHQAGHHGPTYSLRRGDRGIHTDCRNEKRFQYQFVHGFALRPQHPARQTLRTDARLQLRLERSRH